MVEGSPELVCGVYLGGGSLMLVYGVYLGGGNPRLVYGVLVWVCMKCKLGCAEPEWENE